MNATAIQLAINPAPSAPDQGGGLAVRGDGSFQAQLNQAINQGGDPSTSPTDSSAAPDSAKNTKTARSQDVSASLVAPAAASPIATGAAPAAAPNQTDSSADPGGGTSQGASNGVSPVDITSPASSAQASPLPDASRFAWLTAMLPIAGMKLPVSAAVVAAPPSQGDTVARIENFIAKALPTGNQGDATPNAPVAQPGVSPTSATTLPLEPLTNAVDTTASQIPTTATPSAQGAQPQGGSTDAAPREKGNASAGDVAQSFERVGVSILSVSTAATGSSAPQALQASVARNQQPPSLHPSAAPAAANVHTSNSSNSPSDAAAQAARDAGIANTAPASASSFHGASPNAVKPTDGSSGDSSRNGNAQDTGSRSQNTPQGGNGAGAAPAGGAAAAASSAVQAASSGFPLALNQAAQGASATAHSGTPAQTGGSPQAAASKVAAALETPANVPNGVVNAASMIQTQGRAEMRVAVQTDAMGTLQLHAVIDNGKLGASIAVVSHEAHTLLTSELPALQQVLTDQNLRVDRLAVINSPAMMGGSAGNNAGFHSRDSDQPRDMASRWIPDAPAPTALGGGTDTTVREDIRRRLSVRA